MAKYGLTRIETMVEYGADSSVITAALLAVTSTDAELLGWALGELQRLAQADPANLFVTTDYTASSPYAHRISNLIIAEDGALGRRTLAAWDEGALWSLLAEVCERGWEPFDAQYDLREAPTVIIRQIFHLRRQTQP